MDSVLAFFYRLYIIIRKTKRAQSYGSRKQRDKIQVAEISPQRDGYNGRAQNKYPAHGRGTGLRLVSFGPRHPDFFPKLQFFQPPYNERAKNQYDDKRGKARISRPERNILKQSQKRKIFFQRQYKMIKHALLI